jgi:hypothetical protein
MSFGGKNDNQRNTRQQPQQQRQNKRRGADTA